MVSHHGLARHREAVSPEAACRELLAERRCIQLDPLDMIGQNADMVAMARIDGLKRGDIYRHLMPGHAFEHFAKERCLLPASAFPWYRAHIVETDWWGLRARDEKLPDGLVGEALSLIERHGPVTSATLEELGDFGRVEPMSWSGWKGTARAAAMAVEVLWTRCEVVVAGRQGRTKLWDVPKRALPKHFRRVGGRKRRRNAFLEWALIERVHAAGLLARASGPHWSMLAEARTSEIPDRLVAGGILEEVVIEGSRRVYLAVAGALDQPADEPDDRMRILAPLDSMLWDRKLVEHAFGFEYVWEVYKPAARRRWGYYVCPLLHRGELVGRFEARVEDGRLVVLDRWKEPGRRFDTRAFKRALARHEAMM